MQKITPFLWFDTEAEEAMNLYVAIFKNSKVLGVTPGPNGRAMSVNFELEGQEFIGLNAGPQFKFNESISFLVNCNTQAEVDELWEKLTADGGEEGNCGWLKDKYGLSWQITAVPLLKMNLDRNREKADRAFGAMLKMKKLDIAALKKAYAGK